MSEYFKFNCIFYGSSRMQKKVTKYNVGSTNIINNLLPIVYIHDTNNEKIWSLIISV